MKISKSTIIIFLLSAISLWPLISPINAVTTENHVQSYYYYWITGQVIAPADAPQAVKDGIPGTPVVLYKNIANWQVEAARGVVDANGRFMFNAFDFPTAVNANDQFFIATEQRNGWGAGGAIHPISLPISGQGYEQIDLTLALGDGLIRDTWEEDRYVRDLRIRRSSSQTDAELTWTHPEGTPIDTIYYVYKLAAPFANAGTSWTAAPATVNYIAANNYIYSDAGEVGGGAQQAYYRVISANDPTQLTNKVAVGKNNITLVQGWNLLSIPFDTMGADANTTLGSSTFSQNDMLYIYNGVFASTTFDTTLGWPNANNFILNAGNGFWIKKLSIESGQDVLTVMGEVRLTYNASFVKGWNLIGNPFAKNYARLEDVGFYPALNDMMYEYNYVPSPAFRSVTSTFTEWPLMEFNRGRGYWYKQGDTTIQWNPQSNY